jgi:hypothetical protein
VTSGRVRTVLTDVSGSFGVSAAGGASSLNTGDSRLQSSQLSPIASVQRRILHDGIVHHLHANNFRQIQFALKMIS